MVNVTATGGVARIAANRDLAINAATLNNRAGYLLAGNGMNLSGNSLNNQSGLVILRMNTKSIVLVGKQARYPA